MEPQQQPTLLDELAADPFDDDLAKELRTRAPRRLVNRTTLVLGGLLLVVAGFLGGALTQKQYGTPTASPSAAAGNNARAGGQFGGGQFGGRGGGAQGGAPGGAVASAAPAAGGPVTGKVKLIDGTTIYLETADGQTVTVRTNGGTAVQVAAPGALSDLAVGATVTVEGQRADGTVTATKVTRG